MNIRPSHIIVFALLLWPLLSTAQPEVKLKTADGLSLSGRFHPMPKGRQARGAIVALHMYRGDQAQWAPLISPAHSQGLAVLTLDLRGHGKSRKQGKRDLGKRVAARDSSLFNGMYQDAAAAVDWLGKHQQIGPERVILFGASVGCSVALHYGAMAAKPPAAAVLLTPGRRYLGVESLAHIDAWAQRPVLMVTSEEEAQKGAKPLYDKARRPHQLLIMTLPQTGIHGTRMFKLKTIAKRLTEWAALRLPKKP